MLTKVKGHQEVEIAQLSDDLQIKKAGNDMADTVAKQAIANLHNINAVKAADAME